MQESKTEQEAETAAAAASFCVYTITKASTKLQPPLKNNDTLCTPCPGDNKCRGVVGQPRSLLVVDANKTEERIQMQLMNASCTTCPAAGKKGYTFGATSSDVC